MDVRRRAERVNTWTSSILQCLGGTSHVLLGGAAERGDFDFPALGTDGFDGREVTLGSDRKAGFDNIDSEILKLVRHPDLLCQVHRAAGRLFAVTQSGVKNADSGLWHGFPPVGKQGRMLRSD